MAATDKNRDRVSHALSVKRPYVVFPLVENCQRPVLPPQLMDIFSSQEMQQGQLLNKREGTSRAEGGIPGPQV